MMEKQMTILQKCSDLNRRIHSDLFLRDFLSEKFLHERAFTSLDLIEDCESAIEEFEQIPEHNPKSDFLNRSSRSTLYIYGVLQAMYCQQDGLFHLYTTITGESLKNAYELFEIYDFDCFIREVRDDIAGHPNDRKTKNTQTKYINKEFYFIDKGPNSKYKFSYAGYNPNFRKVDVNLEDFIIQQRIFTNKVLDDVEKAISKRLKVSTNHSRLA